MVSGQRIKKLVDAALEIEAKTAQDSGTVGFEGSGGKNESALFSSLGEQDC